MIKDFFTKENIDCYSILSSNNLNLISQKYSKEIAQFNSVIVFLVPYKTELSKDRNISRFAAPHDYHKYAELLFSRFKNIYPDTLCFCDNSPIDEKALAARAGLGVIGENKLLINEKYGSYVFIAEILLKEIFDYSSIFEKKSCLKCGRCKTSCPVGLNMDICFSRLNQTKNLTSEQLELIKNSKYKWGCDICQDVCPMNKNCHDTPIEYFKENLVDTLSCETLENMINSDDFKNRAYAWRGTDTIKRNLNLKNSE